MMQIYSNKRKMHISVKKNEDLNTRCMPENLNQEKSQMRKQNVIRLKNVKKNKQPLVELVQRASVQGLGFEPPWLHIVCVSRSNGTP